ncbi:redox-sensing transcriptional repressor Rex [Bacteroidota bacterium]
MRNLPHKTVERLSKYRRALINVQLTGKKHIFSHELANLIHITSVQVRRDIMLIGYSGTHRRGYEVEELINLIGRIIDADEGQNVAIVGFGNLGKAIIRYITEQRTNLKIAAAFDINNDKINRSFNNVVCYHISKLSEILKKENITVAIITVPADQAPIVAQSLEEAGINGILNYSARPVNVNDSIYLEEYDMITSLEKVAYFGKR